MTWMHGYFSDDLMRNGFFENFESMPGLEKRMWMQAVVCFSHSFLQIFLYTAQWIYKISQFLWQEHYLFLHFMLVWFNIALWCSSKYWPQWMRYSSLTIFYTFSATYNWTLSFSTSSVSWWRQVRLPLRPQGTIWPYLVRRYWPSHASPVPTLRWPGSRIAGIR